MEQDQRLQYTVEQASLPDFARDAHGFPLPGPVVRYFREHMTYTDQDGIIRYWTQVDLATRLQLSERSIRLMENENKHLESIERRRTLAALLKIPPALLGLASFEDLQRVMQDDDPKQLTSMKRDVIDTSEIQSYKETLHAFKNAYEQGELLPQTMEFWIKRINNTIEHVQGKAKDDTLAVVSQYHMLAANTYFHDLRDWTKATDHLNMAKIITRAIDNKDLFTVACYYTGEMYLNQGNHRLARNEFDAVLPLAKSTRPQVRGSMLAHVALAHALTGSDEADRVYVRQLLDEAKKYTTKEIDNNTLMKFDITQYLEDRADILISLKRYSLALECIDEAEEYLINKKRGIEYLRILRAECYIKQRKPEYEQATELLAQILENNKHIQYYVDYVAKLHKLIAASSYGNAPDVVDVGMALRTVQRK